MRSTNYGATASANSASAGARDPRDGRRLARAIKKGGHRGGADPAPRPPPAQRHELAARSGLVLFDRGVGLNYRRMIPPRALLRRVVGAPALGSERRVTTNAGGVASDQSCFGIVHVWTAPCWPKSHHRTKLQYVNRLPQSSRSPPGNIAGLGSLLVEFWY